MNFSAIEGESQEGNKAEARAQQMSIRQRPHFDLIATPGISK